MPAENTCFSLFADTALRFAKASAALKKRFFDNPYGVACSVCDRLWCLKDLKPISNQEHISLLLVGGFDSVEGFQVCNTCRASLKRGVVPTLATVNGFVYPIRPPHLTSLDPVSRRLISARLPFMAMQRLSRVAGSLSLLGQIINMPVDVDAMVNVLPRLLGEDQAICVSIKKHLLHKSTYLTGMVKKKTVYEWLDFLVKTPLYIEHGIVFDRTRLEQASQELLDPEIDLDFVDAGDDGASLMAQQQTLNWNEDKCLEIAPAQNRRPLSFLFDKHAEELSFPDIYYGHAREINPAINVTPFMLATSEIRRRDRRGAKPEHILYMAMKIMVFRVHHGTESKFKCTGTANITRAMLNDPVFMETCIERNLSFLKTIPNSMQYWQYRKRDVFAMIRQLGKPTMFMTLSASETRWPELLNILAKLSDEHNIDLTDPMQQLTALQRATLVSEDPVTCCVYFHKFVDSLMAILSNPRISPFGKYHVVDYFKRIEFQHRGSPHAHILLWLNNDPREAVSEDMPATVELIDFLCSIGRADLPDTYSNQVHKHTFTCYKRNEKHCRFNIPYWPMDQTRILLPMASDDNRRKNFIVKATFMRKNLEEKVYHSFESFLEDCDCSHENYLNVIRASIRRPTVFLKRSLDELWTNSFNPWVASVLCSNMDLQFILEEFACACYIVEYVNKSSRGISNLHRELIKLQEQYPDQDFKALLKKVSMNLLNSVEISAQEAAWFLLRQPMSEATRKVEFIPTMWPHERIQTRKRNKRMDQEGIDDDSTDVWTSNIVQKYEQRVDLDEVCLADFVALYTIRGNTYTMRKDPRVLRWCGYKMTDLTNYKREMVLLFLPFRNETVDILDDNKFIDLYDQNETLILSKLKEYDCDFNIEQTVEEYLRIVSDADQEQERNEATERYNDFVRTINLDPVETDNEPAPTGKMAAVVKKRTNVMSKQDYCAIVRKTNLEQRKLILHLIDDLNSFSDEPNDPIQVFLTGPAGCGKTFTVRILMETSNRYTQSHTSLYNAYVVCASTGKAAVALNGGTIHSTFGISLANKRNSKLSFEKLQLYRNAFGNGKTVFVDEISMVGAENFNTMHTRLQSITGNYDAPFGGVCFFAIGDLNQLPPVNALPVFKACRDSIQGPTLWRSLKLHHLKQVMRQSDVEFSSILTKIGSGEALTPAEAELIESRFRTPEWCKEHKPDAVRLFHTNANVENYNAEVLKDMPGETFIAQDSYTGYLNAEQLASARRKVHQMKYTDTGCLSFMLCLVVDMPYMITTNIETEDGLVNGAIGKLKLIEHCEDDSEERISRLWMKFENDAIGAVLRSKSRSRPDNVDRDWVPVMKRTVSFKVGSITCKRVQFPLVSACALTVHKSQGGTFSEIVFDYSKRQDQQLVYVGLSRVTSLEGLFLTDSTGENKFYHARQCNTPRMVDLRTEQKRLRNHQLVTHSDQLEDFLESTDHTSSLISFNVQSLNAHHEDVSTDFLLTKADLLALSETWLSDCSNVGIQGYHCITEFKRANVQAGGVAIFQKDSSTSTAIPHNLVQLSEEHDPILLEADAFGDICATEVFENGIGTLFVVVYISPNHTYKQTITFLTRNLFRYAKQDIRIVVSGDFNLDILKPEYRKFVQFMKDFLNLDLNSDPLQTTTFGRTCLDLVFVRNIQAQTRRYVSYFSYHRPMLTLVDTPI